MWGHLDLLVAEAAADYARRAEELGYGALWVPDVVGREPTALLAFLAARTARIALGTSIISIWGRDAVTMRMAAMTLHEASGGRFVLGLGVSHPHLAEKVRGHHYERPLTRMREYLAAYRSATYRGPRLDGSDGTAADRAEPPVLLAALRERMLELAAREADGAFPYLVTADRVAWMRSVLDREGGERDTRARPLLAVTLPVVLERGRTAARETARLYLAPYLRTPNYRASWEQQGFTEQDWEKPGSDRLVEAMVASGDENALSARVREMLTAGADHVALIPLARDGTTEHLPVLEALAERRILG